MIALRKYLWVGYTSARSNVAYLSEIATRGIFMAVILFIFLQLWRITYTETGAERLGGLTLAQMLWYLVVTEAISLSGTQVSLEVDQDVRTGTLVVQLIRPISYPLYRLWTTLGERAVRFVLNLVIGALIAMLFVGPIPITLPGLLVFVVSIPFAFVLDFLGMFLIGLGAFWLEDTSGIALIYSRVTWVLGGMLIPLELFPESIQALLRALPFSSVIYGPAHLFILPDLRMLADLLLRQGVAILVFSTTIAAVYRVAKKQISANGG